MSAPHSPETVLGFWFEEIEPAQHWRVDPAFDASLAERFGALLRQAAAGELHRWRASAAGRLAEVIVLDQFSRNIHRGSPLAFAQDGMALVLAQEALAAGAFAQLPAVQRPFLLMPFMHSESAAIHAAAVPHFEALGRPDTLNFALRHKVIVDRFGRYPHRNALLGRLSTEEELQFLQQPGSSF